MSSLRTVSPVFTVEVTDAGERLKNVVTSPLGRYSLHKTGHARMMGLNLIDNLFNSQIYFPLPDDLEEIECVSINDDLRCVFSRDSSLLWIQLQRGTLADPDERNFPGGDHILAAFALDNTGQSFLTHHEPTTLRLHTCSRVLNEYEWKSREFDFAKIPEAAQFSQSGKFIWIAASSSVFRIDSEALSVTEFSLRPMLGNMPDEWPLNNHLFTDATTLIVQSGDRNFAVFKLSEATGPKLYSEQTIQLDSQSQTIEQFFGGENLKMVMCEQQFDDENDDLWRSYGTRRLFHQPIRKVAKLADQSPQPLLIASHFAALDSGGRFDLPLTHPFHPVVGEIPYQN